MSFGKQVPLKHLFGLQTSDISQYGPNAGKIYLKIVASDENDTANLKSLSCSYKLVFRLNQDSVFDMSHHFDICT